MNTYRYCAIDPQGKRHSGTLQAANDRQALAQLRAQQLTATMLTPITRPQRMVRPGRLSWRQLSALTRQLALMLQSGVAIDDALNTISQQQQQEKTKKIIMGLRDSIRQGYSFSAAIKAQHAVFPKIYQTTIEAAEQGGQLGKTLDELAKYLDRQHQIRQKIQQALLYPLLMSLVCIAIVVFLLIHVLPQIVSVMVQNQQTLPTVTQILINGSQWLQQHGLLMLFALCVLFLLGRHVGRQPTHQQRWHRWLLATPIIGKTWQSVNIARFSRSLAILHAATVPIVEAITAAAQLVSAAPIKARILDAATRINEGARIANALNDTQDFPPMIIHLIDSGERSGQLATMLEQSAISLESDIEVVINNALTLFEPLMVLLMGGIVLFIVLAIMLPIFAMDQIN